MAERLDAGLLRTLMRGREMDYDKSDDEKAFEQRSTSAAKVYVNGLLVIDPYAPNGVPNPVKDRELTRAWEKLRAKWRAERKASKKA